MEGFRVVGIPCDIELASVAGDEIVFVSEESEREMGIELAQQEWECVWQKLLPLLVES